MVARHAKSPCCGSRIHGHGHGRLQCVACKKSWRPRPKKRGRPPRRLSPSWLHQTLEEHRSAAALARVRHLSVATVRYRVRQALHHSLAGPAPSPPPLGDLVLLGDGLWLRFHRRPVILYLLALKPIDAPEAYFLDPVLHPGGEGPEGWRHAIATIPASLLARIRALVSDGFRGAKGLVRSAGWVHQRCHFHLLAQMQGRLGRRKPLSAVALREAIYQDIRAALVTPRHDRLEELTSQLRYLAQQPACPSHFRTFVRSFLRDLAAFRAYRHYPELHLPTTTNTVESMINLLRPRLRPLNSPKAALRWATAFIRQRRSLKCNGKDFPPN